MGRFTNRALLGLNKLYTFLSNEPPAPTDLNTEGSVQLVHDVARLVSLSAIETDRRAAGWFSVGQDNVHVGGDTIESTIDPYTSLDPTWGTEGERWIWLMQYAGSVSSTAMFGASASARLAASIGSLGNALARRDFLLATWGPSMVQTITTSLSATFPASLSPLNSVTADQHQYGTRLPFPLFPGSALTWRTAATAAQAGTIRLETICWIGPVGVHPPGMD